MSNKDAVSEVDHNINGEKSNRGPIGIDRRRSRAREIQNARWDEAGGSNVADKES